MFRFLIYLVVGELFGLLAWIVAPILPMFATMQDGWSDNSHYRAVEPRLPWWFGSFRIVLGDYWQRKWVTRIGNTDYLVSLNVGWLLDPYVKNPETVKAQPRALYLFSPRFGRVVHA